MSKDALMTHVQGKNGNARVRVDASRPALATIAPFLLGKFCEHLGSNIYHGMEAQILRNPTFAKWRFGAGESSVDGGEQGEPSLKKIEERVRAHAQRFGLSDAAHVLEAYKDGAAFPWFRVGGKDDVRLSPDAGQHGGRVQRMELLGASRGKPCGLAQAIHLPLHRTRSFEVRLVARASAPVKVELALAPCDAATKAGAPLAKAKLSLKEDWSTLSGRLEIPLAANFDPAGLFSFAITSESPANIVLGRMFLYPGDHVNFADPDIIRMLRDSKLPLLRWPGGNFVSGYRWRDGVGPVDARPTLPNPAWEGLEYNLFGTAEFIAYCKAVGCEPLICVNGGDGAPEEAAAWIEYCNGGRETPMGRLRAEHGHPEPFNVRYWEVGNELYGRWQVGWTTPGGNADRYVQFSKAMLAADPTILLLGCGEPGGPDKEWNKDLLKQAGVSLRCITDHLLTGGPVTSKTDPAELFHAFMGYAGVLGKQYRELRKRMEAAGCKNPRLAITELQLFARFRDEVDKNAPLRPETMPSPATISEALYFSTILFECIRMGDFVEMITHSATVNHGGGLRKTYERVWANPVHYAHALAAPLANAAPLPVQLECSTYSTASTFGAIPPLKDVPVLDSFAARVTDGSLVLLLVHRGAQCGPVKLSVEIDGFSGAGEAAVRTLCGETMHDQNRHDQPERVSPRTSNASVETSAGVGKLSLTLAPFSLTKVVLKAK